MMPVIWVCVISFLSFVIGMLCSTLYFVFDNDVRLKEDQVEGDKLNLGRGTEAREMYARRRMLPPDEQFDDDDEEIYK